MNNDSNNHDSMSQRDKEIAFKNQSYQRGYQDGYQVLNYPNGFPEGYDEYKYLSGYKDGYKQRSYQRDFQKPQPPSNFNQSFGQYNQNNQNGRNQQDSQNQNNQPFQQFQHSNSQTSSNDKCGIFFYILSYLFPIVGFCLYFYWKNLKPRAAKSAARIAYISVCINMISYIFYYM